jgi:hypothetical protein
MWTAFQSILVNRLLDSLSENDSSPSVLELRQLNNLTSLNLALDDIEGTLHLTILSATSVARSECEPRSLASSTSDCAEDIDLITSDNDPEVIEASMSKLTGKLSSSSVEDRLVVETVTAIFSEAGERAKKIKEGTYDFSKDEAQEEIDDIPEQLLETEEDRALDEEEEKQRKKLDGIMNWISLAAVVIAVGLAVFFMLR